MRNTGMKEAWSELVTNAQLYQEKLGRFLWRLARNFLCIFPAGRRFLFPPTQLALRFGPTDARYSWSVFLHHFVQLDKAGFRNADRVLEVGPGPNLGTALLWWATLSAQETVERVDVVCWDVFPNVDPCRNRFWADLAEALLRQVSNLSLPDSLNSPVLFEQLAAVADGRLDPLIAYRVEPLKRFIADPEIKGQGFGLVYSQAAIEHVWLIDAFWSAIAKLTRLGGWHSHRIDLADHGRRETNYIEMLQWSRLGYWLTMRFVPGAINRWRACHHLQKLASKGFAILSAKRILRERLPMPLHWISKEYKNLDDSELRTTALDVVARKVG
jgi:hypothetical protein